MFTVKGRDGVVLVSRDETTGLELTAESEVRTVSALTAQEIGELLIFAFGRKTQNEARKGKHLKLFRILSIKYQAS